MIRVLHTTDLSQNSGITNFVLNYYRYIDPERIQFDFLCRIEPDPNLRKEVENRGGKVWMLPQPHKGLHFQTSEFINELDLFFKMHAGDYAIIHNHSFIPPIQFLYYAEKYKVPIRIVHCHSTKYSNTWMKNLRNRILARYYKQCATHIFACSEEAGEFILKSKSTNLKKYTILHNAVSINKYRFCEEVRIKIRKEFNIANQFVLGCVARFSAEKNHRFTIEIFKEIVNYNNSSKLLLVGEGPLLNQILKQVVDLGLEDKCIFLGYRNDIENILQSLDAFVLPSFFEGVPFVAIEAQAAGLPCFLSSNITKEVDCGLAFFENLNVKASKWAELILKTTKGFKRSPFNNQLYSKGYVIEEEAVRLEKIYEQLHFKAIK